jgi:hypothetical protein
MDQGVAYRRTMRQANEYINSIQKHVNDVSGLSNIEKMAKREFASLGEE